MGFQHILAVRDTPASLRGDGKAGVAVTGTTRGWVSEPEVPDPEKLAWLVLGHGLGGSKKGEIGALYTAASLLLARGESLGLGGTRRPVARP